MNRFQLVLGLLLIAAVFMDVANGDSHSGSGSDSDSNESGSRGKKHDKKYKYPSNPQQYPQPYYHYNNPVYMPQGLPPPMPYYYGYPPPAAQAPYAGHPYPYGGYYNQPTLQQAPSQQVPGQALLAPQGYNDITGGSSIINHSLKVNKEYNEDGHHYRFDGTPTN